MKKKQQLQSLENFSADVLNYEEFTNTKGGKVDDGATNVVNTSSSSNSYVYPNGDTTTRTDYVDTHYFFYTGSTITPNPSNPTKYV